MKIILLTLVLTLAAAAQTPTPVAYSETEDAKPIASAARSHPRTLDEIKSLSKQNKTSGDLIFAYDKFRDQSIVMSKPENLVGSWEGAAAIMASSPMGTTGPGTPRLLMVSVESRFAGQTLRETPDKFALVFDGTSPDWQFLKTGSTLFLLIDGKDRIALAAAASDHDVKRWNRVDEKIAYIITREDLAKVAAAAKVEMRIGDSTPREFKPKLRKRWQSLLEVTKLEEGKIQ